MTGCLGEKSIQVEGDGDWKQWTVAKAGAFGRYLDLIHVNAILPRTAHEPWTAVGHTVDLDGDRRPKVWTSADGASWEVEGIPTNESFDRIAFAARQGRSLVVVGIRGEQGEFGAVASRRDGTGAWSRTSEGIGLLERVGEIAAGPGGLVVAGARPTEGIGLARSVDGLRWAVGFEPELTAGADEEVDAWAYASSRTTEVLVTIAAAQASSSSPQYEPRLWLSSSRRRWTRASVPSHVHRLNEVVAFRNGFVVVGESTGSRPIAGVSADGRVWTWVDLEPVYAAAVEVVVVGEKLVAVGEANPDQTLMVWTSRDGRRWSRAHVPTELTKLAPDWVDVTGGPGGELAIAVHDHDESEVYIGRP